MHPIRCLSKCIQHYISACALSLNAKG
uniref:Uncharacterized protein n=1 Tax=Anguilla anguilla TaxID=7936 RepID=A0A0E9XP31_ANGAN